VKVIWTRHATERQQEWQKKLGITRAEIESVVMHPTQIVAGDAGDWIAQSYRGSGLLRVPFVQVGDDRKVLTVYWTSKIDKYWKGE
jgi:hypothetical protein